MAEGQPPSMMFDWVRAGRPEFVNYFPKYDCIVCRQVLIEAVQTECGHRMCKSCSLDYFYDQRDKPCPAPNQTCGTISDSNIVPDFPVRREILNLKVFCPNKKQGCSETPTWMGLAEHLKRCQFTLVDCKNKSEGCKMKIKKDDMERHLKEECRLRMKACAYCHLEMPLRELQEHVNINCPGVPPEFKVRCKHCHVFITRKDLTGHMESCSKKPRQCNIANCPFTGNEDELHEHTGFYADQHVSLLNDNFHEIDERLKKIEVMNLERLRLDNGKLKETIKSQHKTIANQEQKIMEMQTRINEMSRKFEDFTRRLNANDRKYEEQEYKLEHISSTMGLPEEVRQQIVQYDRTVGIHQELISGLDLKLNCLENTSYDGTLVWKIDNYASRKASAVAGDTVSVFSMPFYTSRYGYKMCARVYLNGDGLGKGTHMSLFFVLMRGEYDALLSWPFRQKVLFSLLDQETGRRPHTDSFRPDPTSTSFRRPNEEMNVATGCPLFLPHSTIESKQFLRDDAIFLRIAVDPT